MYKENARKCRYLSGEIDSLYHEMAVSIGVSDSVLNILYVLCEKEYSCLQSDIFRLTGISRQTINSAIRKLEKDDIVYLEQGNGRNTIVCLTNKGKQFVKEKVVPIFDIENNVWNEWSDDEQRQYLTLTQKYHDSLKKYMKEGLKP